jgi:hypothetical protein
VYNLAKAAHKLYPGKLSLQTDLAFAVNELNEESDVQALFGENQSSQE